MLGKMFAMKTYVYAFYVLLHAHIDIGECIQHPEAQAQLPANNVCGVLLGQTKPVRGAAPHPLHILSFQVYSMQLRVNGPT